MSNKQNEIGSEPSVATDAKLPTDLAGAAARRQTPSDGDLDADSSEAATVRDTDADSSETSSSDGS